MDESAHRSRGRIVARARALVFAFAFVGSAAHAQDSMLPSVERRYGNRYEDLDQPEQRRTPPGAAVPVTIRPPTDSETASPDRLQPSPQWSTTFPLEAPLDPQEYICGRGDTFDLNFWGQQNLHLRVTVDAEGRTFIPKIGYVDIVGKTLARCARDDQEARAPVLSGVELRFEPERAAHVRGARRRLRSASGFVRRQSGAPRQHRPGQRRRRRNAPAHAEAPPRARPTARAGESRSRAATAPRSTPIS